jgi:ABC-type nitrate/sulfonate/bicarbonate transport system substrate-binding protein
MTLRIGVHPNNLHLFLAERWPGAFAGRDVSFVPYAEGRESGALLAAGVIDVCGTGSTVPIMAQSGGLDVLYVAASATRPTNGGILTAGSVETVGDLRGRRVALLDGSFQTYLLAKVLEGAGLGLRDVVRVEMAPGASFQALKDGRVDAWVAMDPLLGQALAGGGVQLLVPCGDQIPNRSVFWTLRRRGFSDDVLDGFVADMKAVGAAIAADPARAAGLLVAAGIGGDAASWGRAVAGRDWSIGAADAGVIAEQQAEADMLARHGDLPHALRLADAAR